ncbi:hypothetical protein DYBT9275_01624 [Dyadobacter sp. CECT 9275]|uniref:Capsule assembly protein Wzi n=1 Tax=Dyadobacter helix TaxID=2822344 RepID=A0A916JCF9_9BACT|nr:capsule assembly Wzi family protein [Dyadobacter sp. CECT 9275]CAG4995383.1 hypothetical protein DYBT9275_01624 [Dyadobacter sp. CECT 9275]
MKKISSILVLTFLFFHAKAQFTHVRFGLEGQAGVTSQKAVPFWMRSNQFGSVPVKGAFASFIGTGEIEYDTSGTKLVDWGARAEVRANAGKTSNVTLIEGYGRLKVGIFELKGGRIKEVSGLSDTLLTSGNYAISGNALGIPKIQISIPEFYSLPFWGKVLAFKGNYAHGWVGKTPVQYGDTSQTTTQFHQKSLYGRFGKPGWKLKLYGGFNHQVFFGDEKYVWSKKGFYLNSFQLSGLKTYEYIVLGKVWNSSKVGNHLGSIDLGFEYAFKNMKLLAYRQTFYEVGGLAHLSNIMDGLNGVSITNLKKSEQKVKWNKLLIEVLYTKNQGGETWSKVTPSGDEDYYNNYLYSEGWSYKGEGLGTPFITSKTLVRDGLPHFPKDYFMNNRVLAFHAGLDLSVYQWHLLSKLSYSRNYGTFGTSPNGHTTGEVHTAPIYGIFPEVGQFSGYLSADRRIGNGYTIGITGALDSGNLLLNSSGILLKAAKTF